MRQTSRSLTGLITMTLLLPCSAPPAAQASPINLVPAAQATTGPSLLQLGAPRYVKKGHRAVFEVHWSDQNRPVSGQVELQQRGPNGWMPVTQIKVRSGQAKTRLKITSKRVYRLKALSANAPAGVRLATSPVRRVTPAKSLAKTSAPLLTLKPAFVKAGQSVKLKAIWKANGKSVKGQVKFQRWNGRVWRTLARVSTRQGVARLTTRPTAAGRYRAVGVSAPSWGKRLRYGVTYAGSAVLPVAVEVPAPGNKAGTPGRAANEITVKGSGWGHGVGMSQYGARGMALAGKSAQEILTHYFTGTKLTQADTSGRVNVQISTGQSATAVTLTKGGATIDVGDTIGRNLTSGDKVTLTVSRDKLAVTLTSGGEVISLGQGTTVSLDPAGVAKVSNAHGTYKRGRLEASVSSGRLNLVNVIRLDGDYLYGVAEVPASWEEAALQAQAIAARTYAYKALTNGLKPGCNCNLYDDVRSQYYAGWEKESESVYGTNWKAAVDATKGLLLTDQAGQPVTTFYSSSSGGRTENSEDVWSEALPQARSVADPWSLDPRTGNPNISWSKSFSGAQLAKVFGLSDVAQLVVTKRTAGGNAAVLTATAASGRRAVIRRAEVIRAKLGLKSAHITGLVVR